MTGSYLLDPDLIAILIAYVFLTYGSNPTGVFAFSQGLMYDLFSGGLHGLSTSLCLIVFGGIYLGCISFDLNNPKGQFIIVFVTMMVKKIAFLVLLTLFSQEAFSLKYMLFPLVGSIVITALIAPVVFHLLDRVKPFFMGGEQNASMDA
jgi:rod shape-determining protein MreD